LGSQISLEADARRGMRLDGDQTRTRVAAKHLGGVDAVVRAHVEWLPAEPARARGNRCLPHLS
jgi:hypothetical protein